MRAVRVGQLAHRTKQVPYNRLIGDAAVPGHDLVDAGLADLRRGIESVPSLLVSIGAPRLRRLGLAVPAPLPDPEHRLYQLLAQNDSDSAHARYNALVRCLVSCEHSLARERSREEEAR